MFKKALSLLLALMLVVASFSVAMVTVAAADDDAAGSASDLTTEVKLPLHRQTSLQEKARLR